MNYVAHVFRDLVGKGIIRICVTDIIIMESNEDEGMKHLERP